MDRLSVGVIHNTLPNQTLYAQYLSSGFNRLGHSVICTQDKHVNVDVRVVIGPHYALKESLNHPTIYIDRCLWGNDLEFVTIGWIRSDGGMCYPTNAPSDRPKPELKPWKKGAVNKPLFLADYGNYPREYVSLKEIYPNIQIRPHPATGKAQKPLLEHLKDFDGVAGFRTSALVTAAIEGYPVICYDYRAPVYPVATHYPEIIKRPDRTQWLNNMSYAQWAGTEIESGEALEYVLSNYPAD